MHTNSVNPHQNNSYRSCLIWVYTNTCPICLNSLENNNIGKLPETGLSDRYADIALANYLNIQKSDTPKHVTITLKFEQRGLSLNQYIQNMQRELKTV